MNNKKRKLELTVAITSIVVGSIVTIAEIIEAATISSLPGGLTSLGKLVLTIAIILILMAIAMVVVGILLCRNPNSNGTIKNTKPLVITLLVFASILTLLYAIVVFSAFAIIPLMMMFACVAVIVNAAMSLATKNDIDQNNNSMQN